MLPAKLRPLHGPVRKVCCCRRLVPASGQCPGGAITAFSDEALLQQKTLETVRATSPMARCLATWDRSSQMSRRVWRQTCKRVVKNNPGLYNKPF